jgi:CHAT domain-containing protein
LRAEQRAGGAPPPFAVVALGDPVFARDGAAGPARLPGTRDEVLAIYRAVEGSPYPEKGVKEPTPPVAVLLAEDATKPRLTELAGRARFVHVATHHVVDANDRASYSRLLLTMPREPSEDDDGTLKLLDVMEDWRGRLARCELVVLSACSTQEGFRQRDEGVFAMPVAFSYAGAPAVVASLWSVADEPTTRLMAAFYRDLVAGKDKLASLRAACRGLRAQRPEPFFWAPFVYLGDPR